MKDREKFLEYCGITAGESSLKKINHKLLIIDRYFKGNTENLKLDDIIRFLSWLNKTEYAQATKNDLIKVLKRYLKWKYKDWNTRFDELKDAKGRGNGSRKLDKEDLLTQEEMKFIISNIESIKYKTMFLLFQETACRPEEIFNAVWKDINWDKGEIKLYSNKTGKTRFIPIKNSLDHLRRYKIECFAITPKADDKVFGTSNQALHTFLRRLEEKIEFSKHLYPYLWRHSILSNMIKKLSPKVYEMYAGHSLETGMDIYAHLDTDDLRDELNEKIYGIEELSPDEKEEFKKLKEEIINLKGSIGKITKNQKYLFEKVAKGELDVKMDNEGMISFKERKK